RGNRTANGRSRRQRQRYRLMRLKWLSRVGLAWGRSWRGLRLRRANREDQSVAIGIKGTADMIRNLHSPLNAPTGDQGRIQATDDFGKRQGHQGLVLVRFRSKNVGCGVTQLPKRYRYQATRELSQDFLQWHGNGAVT